jgi:sporadic carbohydrate cluster 2OG-Fe(II) oxygenase
MKPFERYKIRDNANIDHLKNIVCEPLRSYGFPEGGNLEDLHLYINSSNVNNARLSCFHRLNSSNWLEIVTSEFLTNAQECLGPELLIQKAINVSIQLPNDETSVLPIHSDCNSGDSPYKLNIWIPLTAARETASMFILDTQRSIEGLRAIVKGREPEISTNVSDYVNLQYGEYIIFHPAFLHGNCVNKTEHTRVSLNLRFASTLLERLSSADLGRSFGAYYRVWSESKWKVLSELAIRVIQKTE